MPAKWYTQDIFDLVFPNLDKSQANSVWKEQLSKKEKKKKEVKKDKDEESEDDD